MRIETLEDGRAELATVLAEWESGSLESPWDVQGAAEEEQVQSNVRRWSNQQASAHAADSRCRALSVIMKGRRFPALFLTLLASAATGSAQDFDSTLQPDGGPTIFYLHGRIIEDEGSRPVHDRWGVYDYPAVIEALGSRGAHVVSEVRRSGTNIFQYAGKTIEDIENAIANGVPPDQIVVVGFSKGGVISIHVSSFLRRPEIRYVLLAACGDWVSAYPHLRLTGHVLSVVEESDDLAGSCDGLGSRDDGAGMYRESQISTGKEHGVFFTPRREWLDIVLDWAHRDNI